MARIEAVIFDVGNVLHAYEAKPIHEDIVQTLGISEEDFRRNWNLLTLQLEYGVITEEEYWCLFKSNTGSTAELPTESLLVRKYGVGFRVFDDVLDIAKSLKRQNIRIALLSNSVESHYEFNRKVGLYDEFPIQIFSHQVGLRKPDPEIYQLTLDRLQISATNCLFVDDRQDNIQSAINLGIYGHIFTNAQLLRADLSERFGIVV